MCIRDRYDGFQESGRAKVSGSAGRTAGSHSTSQQRIPCQMCIRDSYTLYHKAFTEIDGGQSDNTESRMNAARDQILSDYGFGGRTMTRIDYDELCDRAEAAEISRRAVSYTHLRRTRLSVPLHRRRMQQKAQMRGKRTIPTASKSTRTCRFCRMAMRSLRMRMGT